MPSLPASSSFANAVWSRLNAQLDREDGALAHMHLKFQELANEPVETSPVAHKYRNTEHVWESILLSLHSDMDPSMLWMRGTVKDNARKYIITRVSYSFLLLMQVLTQKRVCEYCLEG